ncbi:hypothetical protein HYH03_004393 [Edaphochlamys debaryana]|uniref:MYND-type domain-containing protein n=1 Tax=Edaphochlamys debaryana TaxID=47281 RepID=A0A835Y9K9_9CHLO|nr:hypothetical protein HYH03_004393 [Edaphochlamys debaryana]|eukprot:KAG2497654.1 hypothetical protein HYH03_004393 [Edaphochlamys debaryana]
MTRIAIEARAQSVAARLVDRVERALDARAEPGTLLLPEPIRQSVFDSLVELDSCRGLAFEPIIPHDSSADPLGHVLRSKDPSKLHEKAVRELERELAFTLFLLGLRRSIDHCGSTVIKFGDGGRKGPDACCEYFAPRRQHGVLALVVEVVRFQSEADLERMLRKWTTPTTSGGGGAKLALGLTVSLRGGSAELKTQLCAAPQAAQPPQLHNNAVTLTQHALPGDPRNLVWLPLSHLMPGSSRALRAWVAARIAVGGLLSGLCACLRLPPWRAAQWALDRWAAPWAALPLDLWGAPPFCGVLLFRRHTLALWPPPPEEVHNPGRDLTMGTSPACSDLEIWRSDLDATFAAAFASVGLGWAQRIVAAGALTGVTTSLPGSLLGPTRTHVTLGRQALAPPCLARVDPACGTPRNATLCSQDLPVPPRLLRPTADELAEQRLMGGAVVPPTEQLAAAATPATPRRAQRHQPRQRQEQRQRRGGVDEMDAGLQVQVQQRVSPVHPATSSGISARNAIACGAQGQILEALAKQASAAAAVLSGSGGAGPAGAGPSAAAAAAAGPSAAAPSSDRLRLRSAQLTEAASSLVAGLASFTQLPLGRAMAKPLLAALRSSHLFDHVGLLLLLISPSAGDQAAPQALVDALPHALSSYGSAADQVSALRNGTSDHEELHATYGTCGRHALLTLGSAVLAAADLGPSGLPYSPLPAAILMDAGVSPRPYPCVEGRVIRLALTVLSLDRTGPQPAVANRAAVRLVLRALRLAAASTRESQYVATAPGGFLRVDMCWGGRCREEWQDYRLLLCPHDGVRVGGQALKVLVQIACKDPGAWLAEAELGWAQVVRAVRHLLQATVRSDRRTLIDVLVDLLVEAARPLMAGGGLSLNTPLPASVAAFGRSGAVPLLETAFRLAVGNPSGPEDDLASELFQRSDPLPSIAALLVHSPPRQAAALISTLAKLLRWSPPAAMRSFDLTPWQYVWVRAACALLEPGIHTLRVTYEEPPGPVDLAAPCAPLFVSAFAALALLPELSRTAQEAAQRVRVDPAWADASRILDPAAHTLSRVLLAASGIVPHRARGTAPTHRVVSAVCLTFLVEECGAVPLLGSLLEVVAACGASGALSPSSMENLALCCLQLFYAYPERILGGGGSGGGSSTAAAGAVVPWRPPAVRALARHLRVSEPTMSQDLEALAVGLEQPQQGSLNGRPDSAEVLALLEAGRLAALQAEVRALLPACANPACVNLAGDSEAGLQLKRCRGCAQASYCSGECQAAHWKAGHKAVCVAEGG